MAYDDLALRIKTCLVQDLPVKRMLYSVEKRRADGWYDGDHSYDGEIAIFPIDESVGVILTTIHDEDWVPVHIDWCIPCDDGDFFWR